MVGVRLSLTDLSPKPRTRPMRSAGGRAAPVSPSGAALFAGRRGERRCTRSRRRGARLPARRAPRLRRPLGPASRRRRPRARRRQWQRQDEPDTHPCDPARTGRLPWGGEPVAADLAGHRARLAYVGHQDAVKPALSPRETLRFWAALRGLPPARAAPRIAAALAAFALEEVADWPCRWLSAGQRRRLSLARLVAVPAAIWLLDEPTSALDRANQARLEALIAAHRHAGGRVVVATHLPLAIDGAEHLRLDDFAAAPGGDCGHGGR